MQETGDNYNATAKWLLKNNDNLIDQWLDADKAAAILEEMTGDTNLVAKILNCMTSKQRGAVLAAMDPVYAAKITKIMYP